MPIISGTKSRESRLAPYHQFLPCSLLWRIRRISTGSEANFGRRKLNLSCSGADTIHTHPRSITTLVRRPDDARKAKRAARAEKKAAQREALEENIKRSKGKKEEGDGSAVGRVEEGIGG